MAFQHGWGPCRTVRKKLNGPRLNLYRGELEEVVEADGPEAEVEDQNHQRDHGPATDMVLNKLYNIVFFPLIRHFRNRTHCP